MIKKSASNLMVAGGIAELVIALLHFVWPLQLIQIGKSANIPTDLQNLLVLFCIVVGFFLTIFGVLSIYFSQGLVAGKKSAKIYGFSQVVFWGMRIILEIILPVEVPLLIVAKPTVLIIALSTLTGLMFSIPLLVFNKESNKETGLA